VSTEVVRSYARTANPEGRRASAAARHEPATYGRSVARRWPNLTEEKRAEFAASLAPTADDLITILVRVAPPLSENTRSQLRAMLATQDGGE
jgi:hypothetical protein